jgi:hypothetical protein
MRFQHLVGGPYDGATFEREIFVPDLAKPEVVELLGRLVLTSGVVSFHVRPPMPCDTYHIYILGDDGLFHFAEQRPTTNNQPVSDIKPSTFKPVPGGN